MTGNAKGSVSASGPGREADLWMERAFSLAAQGGNRVSPNPRVGAVVVRNGRLVGEGFHREAGREHAEKIALQKAGRRAEGADLYITLEPCSTRGKTPACTEAIIQARVQRVFIGALDSNPQNRRKAGRILAKAGIPMVCMGWEHRERELNCSFHHQFRSPYPYVRLKAAVSLDGQMMDHRGRSQWISGTTSRVMAHELRRLSDAILVGAGTVNADNPRLTVRLPGEPTWRDPVKVVLSPGGSANPRAQILHRKTEAPVLLVTTPAGRRKIQKFGPSNPALDFRIYDRDSRGVFPLKRLLRDLRKSGITSLLVEGGARVLGAFLAAGLFHEFHCFMAPRLFGDSGYGFSGNAALESIGQPARLALMHHALYQEDLYLVFRNRRPVL